MTEDSKIFSDTGDFLPNSSEFLSSSPSQNSASSRGPPGERSVSNMPEFSSTLSESPVLLYSRNNSQYSSANYSSTLSSQDPASDEWQQQASSHFWPKYQSSRPTWNENNQYINQPFEDGEPASYNSGLNLTTPIYSLSPTTPLVEFGLMALSEPGAQVNYFSESAPRQVSLATLERPRTSIQAHPIARHLPSPCRDCHGLEGDKFLLHYWTVHPPPTGSPHAWTERRCMWNECRLGKTFKSPKTWSVHAYNVHLKRYRCEDCTIDPFGNLSMLARHIRTKHKTPTYCKKIGCQGRRSSNLCRRDKKLEHEKKWHGSRSCQVTGCLRKRVGGDDNGFSTQAELDKHMSQKHWHV